jgi:hypothetical protein
VPSRLTYREADGRAAEPRRAGDQGTGLVEFIHDGGRENNDIGLPRCPSLPASADRLKMAWTLWSVSRADSAVSASNGSIAPAPT